MFLLITAFALPLLGLWANARPIDDTVPGITSIEDQFQSGDLVPELLASFNPSAVMNVTFPGVGPISAGQNLSVQQVSTAPGVTISPANSSFSTTGNFTLMMVDAFPFGMNDSTRQILHWLTNSATLQNDSSSLNVSTDGALVVTDYFPPAPPVNSGVHRYVIMLFNQTPSYSPPANLSSPNVGIDLFFHLTNFISSTNLGQPIAGMFFEVSAATNASATGATSSSATVSGSAS